MNRLAVPAAILALALAGLLVAHAFFDARDDSTVDRDAGPGIPIVTPGVRVAPGNVVLLYSRGALGRPLQRLAADIGGDPAPALIAARQAVLVRRSSTPLAGVRALTATRRLDATTVGDPALRRFVEFWLGRDP